MNISRFEDLIGWQRSRELFRLTYEATQKLPLSRDFPIRDQLKRSSLSVMSNIAEGFERGGDREFVQFLFLAKGSCAELRSQIQAARDIGHLTQEDHRRLKELAEETSRILQGLIRTIKARVERGHKF